jgi:hypothetical protein
MEQSPGSQPRKAAANHTSCSAPGIRPCFRYILHAPCRTEPCPYYHSHNDVFSLHLSLPHLASHIYQEANGYSKPTDNDAPPSSMRSTQWFESQPGPDTQERASIPAPTPPILSPTLPVSSSTHLPIATSALTEHDPLEDTRALSTSATGKRKRESFPSWIRSVKKARLGYTPEPTPEPVAGPSNLEASHMSPPLIPKRLSNTCR